MSGDYLNRDRVVTAKLETTAGEDATPTPADNAVAVIAPEVGFDFAVDQAEDEASSSLDAGEPTVLGGGVTFSGSVKAKGSGTAGTAPEFAPFLAAAAMAVTVTGTAIAGTAASGGASTLTLATGDGADVAPGMPIALTGGAGSGDERTIVAVSGDEVTVDKPWSVEADETSAYSVPANVLYQPASADLNTATVYEYLNSNAADVDSRLTKLVGCVFNVAGTLAPRSLVQFTLTGRGKLGAAPSEVARPAPSFQSGTAPRYTGVAATLGGADVPLQSFAFDLGNNLDQPENPLDDYGVDAADVTARMIAGTLSFYVEELATRALLAEFLAGAERLFATRWGTTAGNKIALTVPRLRWSGNPSNTSVNNYAGEQIPWRGVGPDGGLLLCFY